MKHFFGVVRGFCLVMALSAQWLQAGITPVNLRCGSWQNPPGIDDPHPRLSWQVPASPADRAQSETAWQIQAASSGGAARQQPAGFVGQRPGGFRAALQCRLRGQSAGFRATGLLAGAGLGSEQCRLRLESGGNLDDGTFESRRLAGGLAGGGHQCCHLEPDRLQLDLVSRGQSRPVRAGGTRYFRKNFSVRTIRRSPAPRYC